MQEVLQKNSEEGKDENRSARLIESLETESLPKTESVVNINENTITVEKMQSDENLIKQREASQANLL